MTIILITERVVQKWHSKTKKYYESKGYVFTKMGDEFEVNVEDLTNSSTIYVDVRCDGICSKDLKKIKWNDYKRQVNENGEYYCKKCAMKFHGYANMIKTKLKNGKSFEQWCVDNNRQDILDRWDYELNDCKPIEVSYSSSRMKYYFKCPKGLHDSESKNISTFTTSDNRKNINCEKCNSFGQWCIDNDKNELLSRWDYELNNKSPFDIGFSVHDEYYFKCNNKTHESELKNINRITNMGIGNSDCKKCNSFAQHLIDLYGENALELYWNYDKNTVDPWQISKGTGRIKVWIICQNKKYHESYNLSCKEFLKGNRCSYCRGLKVHPMDSLGSMLKENGLLYLWSDKNKKSSFEYAPNSHNKVYWKCGNKNHDDYLRDINSSNYLCNFRCPECVRERDESFLQEKVRLYLNELGYMILHEHNCTILPVNPKKKGTNNILPYDNEVKELKLIIEVHGKQHYETSGFHIQTAKKNNTTPEQELHYQQLKDRYKRIYAKLQGYNYLEIPYTADDKEKTWRQLIDDKIKNLS